MVRPEIWSKYKRGPNRGSYKRLYTSNKPFRNSKNFVGKMEKTFQVDNERLKCATVVRAVEREFWNRRSGKADTTASNIFRIFPASDEFPDMIDSIGLTHNRDYGRFYRVKVPAINVGQVIFKAKPFASAVNRRRIAYCLTCNTEENIFIPCDQCVNVKFCSMECKTTNKAHAYECASNFHNVDYGPNNDIDIKLSIQVVLEALAIFDGNVTELREFIENLEVIRIASRHTEPNEPIRQYLSSRIPTNISDKKSRFLCFMHLQKVPIGKIRGLNIRKALENILDLPKVRECFDDHHFFLEHFLAHNLAVIRANGFHTPLGTTKRALIYDSLSFFNHSCEPNVLHFMQGNSMICVTGRYVQENEQLYISYLDESKEFMPTENRKVILETNWGINCGCRRCETKDADNAIDEEKIKFEIRDADLYDLEKSLNEPKEWNFERGLDMIVYYRSLSQLLFHNRNFLKN